LVPFQSQMVSVVKKAVAIGIAGAAAVVVAAWRQVQRDNTLATDSGTEEGNISVVPTPRPAGTDSGTDVPDSSPPASASALFTPSVSEDSTKAELYEVATELKIEGRSKMNKSELLDAIRAAS